MLPCECNCDAQGYRNGEGASILWVDECIKERWEKKVEAIENDKESCDKDKDLVSLRRAENCPLQEEADHNNRYPGDTYGDDFVNVDIGELFIGRHDSAWDGLAT